MYPINHYMDPYSSYYRHNAPYPYYPPPGWEAGRQRMPEVDSSCRPPYGPWPYSGSTNHSGLPESHSCCSHTYPPGYYSFRPPFPQELPPPPLYYHGPFPPHHPHPYSSSYFGPLPPYPVDQTPYGHDKFKSHCCGCRNHVCHGGQKSNLKIEEHMPEVKDESNQKVADNSSIIRNPNYQYPVMWLPSGDMKDNANGTSFEFSPQLFSKWFPQSGERTEDVKPADDNQKAKQLQWPIVCMPQGYNETKQQAKKELKEIEQSPKNTQEDPPSPKIKIIPLSWFENDSHDQKPAARDGSGEQSGRSSVANPTAGTEHRHDKTVDGNCKTISVVPEKPNTGNGPAISVVPEKPNSGNEPAISVVPEKQDVEKKVRTCRTIPVMAQKESDEKKSYMDGSKEEKKPIMVQKEGENRKNNNVESSKAKVSKLPPVCLRLDPLPKKKSGNTSSRSSNPAARKACEKDKDMKEAQAKNQEPKLSEQQKEGNMPVKEKSSDEIGKNIGSRNITVQDSSTKHAQEEQVSTSIPSQKVQPIVSAEAQENFSARSLHECDKNKKEDEMKIQREAPNLAREINLSEPDAAVRIQSAYRGHLVRRCKPLEKLRKIKNVHKQMQDVEKKLQALEASSEQPTEKEHIAINETIMDLLLNLDNIQNLHPVVREARKSVARQLVCLQEMLDSLCKKLPAEANHSKSEEVSLAGVDEEQLPSSVNSKEPMHDNVSSEVSLKFSEDGDSTEQKHQMEESSTAKEEAEDEGEATAPTECPGVPPMDVMHGAALSGLITEKQQIEEPDFLREECTEEEKAPAKGEGSSTDYMEPLHYTTLSEDSALKQCTPSAEQSCHTEESGQGVSRATTEDGTTAIATASTDSEAAVGNDCSAEGGRVLESASVGSSCLKHDAAPAEDQCKESSAPSLHLEDSSVSSKVATTFMDSEVAADGDGSAEEGSQVQEYASVGGLSLKHDAAPAEDQCKEPSVPSLHLEDSSVPSQVADPHGNDPALADDSIVITPGDQQEGLVEKEAADTMLDSGEEADGTPTPAVGDTGNMDDVTAANAENSTQEKIALVGSEATKECEVSPMDDSALAEQQNEGGSGIAGETEAVPLENEGKTMEDTQNGVIGEEPEAVPLESRARTMESTLNENTLNDAGSLPRNTSAEPALPESAGDGAPSEHDGAVVYHNPGSKVSPESHGDLQEEQDDDDGVKVSASEATEGNASVPAETPVCATRADPAVLEAEKLKEGVPPEQEAAGAASATQDDLKSDHDDKNKNKGLADENQKLKEMLQKLLASGNDQMGVIEELSDKVKSLERKLARMRRPKVRVQHRPARNATTNNVH